MPSTLRGWSYPALVGISVVVAATLVLARLPDWLTLATHPDRRSPLRCDALAAGRRRRIPQTESAAIWILWSEPAIVVDWAGGGGHSSRVVRTDVARLHRCHTECARRQRIVLFDPRGPDAGGASRGLVALAATVARTQRDRPI